MAFGETVFADKKFYADLFPVFRRTPSLRLQSAYYLAKPIIYGWTDVAGTSVILQ